MIFASEVCSHQTENDMPSLLLISFSEDKYFKKQSSPFQKIMGELLMMSTDPTSPMYISSKYFTFRLLECIRSDEIE